MHPCCRGIGKRLRMRVSLPTGHAIQGISIMPTVAPTQRSALPVGTIPGDNRFAIVDATWDLYDRLTDAVGEGKNIRLAFDGKDLEVMTTGPLHEGFKDLLSSFVKEVAVELEIEYRGLGQTTWKRPDVGRGLEADLCFLFDAAKLLADAHAGTQVQ